MTTPPTSEQAESPPEFVVEANKPFSQSLIWTLQRRYYEQQGIRAWSDGKVPFSISTNPNIARAYSRLIHAFLRDHLAELDLSEPVYLVEIGAGSGRLGFHILQQLADLWQTSPIGHVRYCYVLTDLVEANVEFWATHPKLQPFLAAGQLDRARFDAVQDTTLHLRQSGRSIQRGTLKNPLIVLANYIWDTLPQDLFFVEQEQLYEVQVALHAAQPETNLHDPELISRIEIVYDRFPTTPQFYGDERLTVLLEDYRQQMPAAVFTFPAQAIACMHALCDLADNRLLMLSADKGDHELDKLTYADGMPPIALHDNGFSTQFNYHAIVRYFENLGGTVLTTPHSYCWLNILAVVLQPTQTHELRLAYRDMVIDIGVDDIFAALGDMDKLPPDMMRLLAYLRCKLYDPHAFLLIMNKLLQAIPTTRAAQIENIRQMIAGVWANYYHIGEPHNLPFYLGRMAHSIREYTTAEHLYGESLRLYGDHPRIRYNLALCRYQQGAQAEARAMLAQILHDLPDFPEAQRTQAEWDAQANAE